MKTDVITSGIDQSVTGSASGSETDDSDKRLCVYEEAIVAVPNVEATENFSAEEFL